MTTIDLRVLEAISAAASKEETRYYLNGVLVEARPRHVTYVATDGHWLAAYRDALDDDKPDNDTIGDWIIPTGYCRPFKLSARERRLDYTADLSTEDGKLLRVKHGSGMMMFYPIDGSFPSWRRVVPAAASGETAEGWFGGDIAQKLDRLGEALGVGRPKINQNGKGAMVIRYLGDDLFAVVMPGARQDRPSIVPSWAEAAAVEPEKVAA